MYLDDTLTELELADALAEIRALADDAIAERRERTGYSEGVYPS